MTELLPAPATPHELTARPAMRRPVTVDPAWLVDEDAGGCVDLGPDWTAVRAFAGTVLALAVAALVGHRVAGPAGIVTAAGLVALALFIAAHIRAWAASRRLARPAAIDAYEPVSQRVSSPSTPPDVVLSESSSGSSSGRNDLPGVCETGSYASTDAHEIRSGATGPGGFFWWCGVCRVESIKSATRAETLDLAAAHDRLHHRRPTAAVLPSAPVASSTREAS